MALAPAAALSVLAESVLCTVKYLRAFDVDLWEFCFHRPRAQPAVQIRCELFLQARAALTIPEIWRDPSGCLWVSRLLGD